MLVTSRFGKLLIGYVEVVLGLLSEAEAADLLLGTAEITSSSTGAGGAATNGSAVATDEQFAAAKTICKLCGA